MKNEERQALRAQAVDRLDAAAKRNRALLQEIDPHNAKLIWTPYAHGMQAKVGRGHLRVSRFNSGTYAGVQYTSSMGPDSDDSYGGFLPGVTFDEALLLVYRDFKRNTK